MAEPTTLAARPGCELISAHSQVIWHVVRHFMWHPEDAEDAYQATAEKLLRYGGSIRDPRKTAAWVAAVARNECRALLNRGLRHVPAGVDGLLFERPDPHDPPDEALLRAERAREVRAAVARLPERARRVLWLLFADEPASYAEVSAVTGMPQGSIGPTLGRSLARLRLELEVTR